MGCTVGSLLFMFGPRFCLSWFIDPFHGGAEEAGPQPVEMYREACVMNLKSRVYLFNQLDALLQVHTKVNERPLYPLPFVLFLLKDKHVVVEELLEPFVGEVYAQLLKSVILERFE